MYTNFMQMAGRVYALAPQDEQKSEEYCGRYCAGLGGGWNLEVRFSTDPIRFNKKGKRVFRRTTFSLAYPQDPILTDGTYPSTHPSPP